MPIRLTLRSMLNYMDDVLEPADAAEIAQRIEESEFATSLMHRVRDVTKRLRLAAPKVEGRGMGLDPNTVAEYLDNTLHGDRVPEFEKVCLESDVHLAEIASVHQILTLVLGEPAEIDPVSRMRMYALTEEMEKGLEGAAMNSMSQVAPAQVPTSMRAAASQPAAVADEPPRTKAEIPEYLRETPRQRSMAATIAIAACLLLLVGGLTALVVKREALMAALGNNPTEVTPGSPEQSAAQPESVVPSADTPKTPPDMPTTPPAQPGAAIPGASVPGTPSSGSTPPALTNPEDKRPGASPTTPATPGSSTPSGTPLDKAPPAPEPAPVGGEKPAMKPADTAPPVVTVDPTKPALPVDPTKPDPTKPDATKPDNSKPMPVAPEPPAAPEGIGRVISEKEVLLRFDRPTKTFRRLAASATTMTGDQFLSLPASRPEVALSAGVNLRPVGETAFELIPPDNRGVPGVRLVYGRLLMLTVGRPDVELRVHAGDKQGVLKFGNADATAGLEVTYRHKDGTDPEQEPSQVQVDLYAISGDMQWIDGSNPQPEPTTAPARRVLSGLSPGSSPIVSGTDQLAPWTTKDDRVGYEKLASATVEEELASAERATAVTLGLRELAVNPRVEVRLLAVTCLAHLGDFELIIKSLSDETQKAYWSAPRGQIATLQDALARSPATAAMIRESLTAHRGKEKGDELYRLLWGFSLDQMHVSAAPQLIKWLDHQDLDYRVLSFANLVKTSGSTLGYRPEFTQTQRQQSLRTWDTRFKSGQLLPKLQ